MIDVGLILARFAHYVATTVLFGVSLFPLYAYREFGTGAIAILALPATSGDRCHRRY